jgi:hypothetical protein
MPVFKEKVALATVKRDKTSAELAQLFNVRPKPIMRSNWGAPF